MISNEVWISVDDRLPEIDEWVIVFEDDTENPQDQFINDMFNHDNYRVKPAKIAWLDCDGYPNWHLCYIGGGPAGRYRNVTHWQPMPIRPKSFLEKEEELIVQSVLDFSE